LQDRFGGCFIRRIKAILFLSIGTGAAKNTSMIPAFPKNNLIFICAGALGLAALFCSIYLSNVMPVSFDIDEADYMYSLEKGFAANYFDRNTLPFPSFVKVGLSKGRQKGTTTELSSMIRSSDDIFMYRHFHGPFYFYYMMLGEKIFGTNERAVRSITLVLLFLCSVIALAGCLFLSGPTGRLGALLAALLILFSPSLFFTTSLVSPHGMYVLLSLISLFLMAKAVATKKEAYFILSMVTIALAFVTLEYAFLLLLCWFVSTGTVFLMDRAAFPHPWKFIIRSLCIYGLVTVVLWPASILKLSLVKGYVFLAYFVIVRGHVYTSTPLLQFWWNRIYGSPVEYSVLALGTILAVYCIFKRKKTALVPFVAYVIFIFLLELRHIAPVPTYVSSLVAAGFVAAGMSVSELFQKKTRLQSAVLAVFCTLSFLYLYFSYMPRQKSPRLELRTEMKEIIKKEMPKKVLVVRPLLSLVHYYFRRIKADSYTSEDYSRVESIADIRTALTRNSDYDGIIYNGNSAEEVEAVIAERYDYDPVNISRADWAEQWVYFRLKPKQQNTIQ
jgi:hypothetical protein